MRPLFGFLAFSALILSAACSGPFPTEEPPTMVPSPAADTVPTEEVLISAVSTPTVYATATPIPSPVPPEVESISPRVEVLNDDAIEFRALGRALKEAQAAYLVADDRDDILLRIAPESTDVTLILMLDQPERVTLNGQGTYMLQVEYEKGDTIVYDHITVTLRDFMTERVVKGLQADYQCTGRVNVPENNAPPFTRMREIPDVAGTRTARLQNQDRLQIIRRENGWYQARIIQSHNPELISQIWWIETWLVDNMNVPECPPPTPTPQLTVIAPTAVPSLPQQSRLRQFAAIPLTSYPGTGDSGQGQSCIDVQVLGWGNVPIAGAAVQINNAHAWHHAVTDGNGYTWFCNLYASNWTVLLEWVPPDAAVANASTVVYVNGSPGQRAGVNFVER
jgi:hypothetical protein